MSTDATDSAPPLEYAPRPSRFCRKRWRRGALLLILVGIAVAGWRYGPGLLHQGQLLYWQRQCLNFQRPADFVAFESDPAKAAALITRGSHRPLGAVEDQSADGSWHWVRDPFAALYPDCWDAFGKRGGDTQAMYGAYLYLHERQAPSGKRLLISVYAVVPLQGNGCTLHWEVIDPATWTTPSHAAADSGAGQFSFNDREVWPSATTRRDVRIYAGRSDANDPSRFAIPFDVNGRHDTIEGKLRDDDGSLIFQLRSQGALLFGPNGTD